ncbi:exopolysaccharide biosynthesis polyprenyl glycosylphosphotransferase [Aeromicrobium sp. S22]|uniref:sugar transferase n=1 Tax=Aeromicrobium sp. S22 TaxID=2662029 RepID=UPI00129E0367|nr:sugar transferase [Aeromicrobium sp. S22]MRJ99895.1 exopolysaccharide biosynthesis polyprenyl glycosylphosphotransferase [Aeromicrobium sp. S22]
MTDTISSQQGRHDAGSQQPARSGSDHAECREGHARSGAWRTLYARGLSVTDALSLGAAVVIAEFARFGTDVSATTPGSVRLSYTALGVIIAAVWWLMLTLGKTRDVRILGEGAAEYRLVIRTTVLLFGWVAIASVLLKFDMSRGYLGVAFPVGLGLILVNRKLWRVWLHRGRAKGRNMSRVLVIGGIESALHTARVLQQAPTSGMAVSGVWIPDRQVGDNERLEIPGGLIPVLGTHHTIADALSIAAADAVIVTDTEHLGPAGLRSLAWDLEGADVEVDLLVSPNVVDVSGPRIHLRAVANMPFIQLEEPQYAGAAKLSKVVFDKTTALLALIVLSPLLLCVAVSVKATSPGPVLYRSTRVGVGGVSFEMLKFRTMVSDADQHVASLATLNDGSGPMFKMRKDPRVTGVGRHLRRFSIDELPQLFNVLRGEMSLVGPRPPLPSEVAEYEGHVSKRLLVRQGITGLWQVSGRSDLTWDETVRLDLDYVENWSMLRDLQIIWRTLRAVVRSEGAY